MFFSREFLSHILKTYIDGNSRHHFQYMIKVNSLPNSLLSGAIRKIGDSFPPIMGLLTFNESLNFPLWIDSTGPEIEIRQVEVAFHFKDRSSLYQILTSVSLGRGILIWFNRWASYPSLNMMITQLF